MTRPLLPLLLLAVLSQGSMALADNGKPVAQPQVQAQAPTLPLRVVSKEQFCGRLAQVFSGYGQANGYDRVQTAMLANGATARVLQEFKTGRASDYINAASLANFSNVPNKAPANGYLPLAGFVGQAMGLGQNVTLALSPGELRFIPFAQKGMDVVVIAQNAAAMTPDRAKKVAEVARASQIKINVIWVGASGDERQDIEEARSLAWLAAVTGGAFANLGGRENPCAAAM